MGAGGCGNVSDNVAAEGSTSGGVAGATGIGGSDGVCGRVIIRVTTSVGANPSCDMQKASMSASNSKSSGMGGGHSSRARAGGNSDRTTRGEGVGSITASSGGKSSRHEASEAGGATVDGRDEVGNCDSDCWPSSGDLGRAGATHVTTVDIMTNSSCLDQTAVSLDSSRKPSGKGGGHSGRTWAGGGIDGAIGWGCNGTSVAMVAGGVWGSDAASNTAARIGVCSKTDSAGSDGGAAGAWGTWQTGAVGMGKKDSIGGDRGTAVMSTGGMLTGEGVGDRATPSGSGSASSGQFNGAGCRDWASEADNSDLAGMVGVTGGAGNRRASSTARDSIRVGAGD